MAVKPASQPTEPTGAIRLANVMEVVSFAVLVIVVAMRPLLTETYDSGIIAMDRAVGQPDNVTPALTASFDTAIWLVAVAATSTWMLRRWRWRYTGIELGLALMTLGAIVSICYASNKRLALNASFDWLTAWVMLVVVANLCRTRLRVILLLAALAASGVATSAKCLLWKAVEHPETVTMYEQEREAIWAKQGIDLDDPRVELFEGRLRAGEASGFFPHSNIAGSWLMLIGLAALGLADMADHRGLRIVLRLLAMVLLASIWMTGSRGAIMAGVAGLVLYGIVRLAEPWVRRHTARTLTIGWGVFIFGIIAVVGHGSYHDSLPGKSLAYRWNYWQVTSRIIADQPITGTGALNFDRAYLAHKPVEYPEEIQDPHNALLAVVSQWGVIGGLGLVLAVAMGSVVAITRIAARDRNEAEPKALNTPEQTHVVRWIAGISVSFIVARMGILQRTTPEDAARTAVIFFDIGFYGLAWVASFAGVAWGLMRFGPVNSERGRIACLCATAAFILHNMISFSLFYPGSLTAFAAVGGLLLSQRGGDEPVAARRRWIEPPVLIAVLGCAAFWWWVGHPLGSVQQHLRVPRQVLRDPLPPQRFERFCLPSYVQAAQADRYDPTPLSEAARNLCVLPEETYLRRALQLLSLAVDRDPKDLGVTQFRRRVESELYRLTRDPVDLEAAIATARKAITLYPNSPDEHLALADLLAKAAEIDLPDRDEDWYAAACDSYRRAVELNDARPADEIRRWPARIRERAIRQLEVLATCPAASRPS